MKRYLSLFLLSLLLLAGCSPVNVGYPPADYRIRNTQCQVKDGRITQNTIRALEKATDFQEFYYIEYQGVGEGRKTPTESITATDLLVKDYDRLLDAVMELWPEDAWYTIQYDQCFKGEMEVRISMSQGNGRGYYVYSLADGALIPGDQKIVGEERFGRMVVIDNTESGNIARTTYIFIAE